MEIFLLLFFLLSFDNAAHSLCSPLFAAVFFVIFYSLLWYRSNLRCLVPFLHRPYHISHRKRLKQSRTRKDRERENKLIMWIGRVMWNVNLNGSLLPSKSFIVHRFWGHRPDHNEFVMLNTLVMNIGTISGGEACYKPPSLMLIFFFEIIIFVLAGGVGNHWHILS